MSAPDVLVLNSRPKAAKAAAVPSTLDSARAALGGMGIALALVGWIDWALLWFPLQFGTVEWEFGTISSSFDALPLATIGTAAIVIAALAGAWRRTLLVIGVLSMLAAVSFVLVFGIYLLDVPVLLQGAVEAVRGVMMKAIIKTSSYALLYTATYAWLGVLCVRAFRKMPKNA